MSALLPTDSDTDHELFCLPYSPWSLRVKWVLGNKKFEHRYGKYTPGFSEKSLKRRMLSCAVVVPESAKDPNVKVTVPVLFYQRKNSDGASEDICIADSFDIARYVDAFMAPEKSLFPDSNEAEIKEWAKSAEVIMNYGRKILFDRVSSDKKLGKVFVPRNMSWLGPVALMLVKRGMKKAQLKYAEESEGASKEQAVAELNKIRAQLKKNASKNGSSPYLCSGGTFTYADIVVANAFQLVSPEAKPYANIMPEMAKAALIEDLAQEYQDIIDWRNQMLKKHHHKYE